ncbi:hypothetical protein [Paenibacillus daejeonensis]|uniref:hypothetical protein n=1 Tax=Paenibacillus daejeonensis TaxID=135193 RepID=UPI00036BBB20|nr:hypothetical protein [Paenibacillus daejeonensis]
MDEKTVDRIAQVAEEIAQPQTAGMSGQNVPAGALGEFVEKLRTPEAKWRIQPFWFWNGDLEDEEITRQIAEMAEQGVGGFFVCARQGMHVPYLSDAWFAKVRVAAEAALEHGLEVWLYDEYPYPSGIAGGEVILEHPDAKQRMLVHRTLGAAGGELCVSELPWGRVLSARAIPRAAGGELDWERSVDIRRYIGNDQVQPVFQKTGLTAYNQKRFFTYQTVQKLQWAPPAGDWEVHIFLEEEIEDFKYYGTFVDPCHKEAMATFIRLTHQRYADELGAYFGRPIRGMFTDEIAPLGKVPWSPRVPEAFLNRRGYRIEEHLEALIGGLAWDGAGASTGCAPGAEAAGETARAEGSGVSGLADGTAAENAGAAGAQRLPVARVRYDFYLTVHELLQESYHQPVSAWCEQYGLHYVTEVPSMRLSTQAHSHVPGGDSAHEKIGRSLDWILDKYTADLRANPKMVSSVSAQYGRERALIECFHSVGWSMTLQDARWMIDRMAAMGINFYNFHAFFYTLDGMTQHDAPPSQFDQNPYWKHFRRLGDYTGRISKLMGTGRAVRRIAMLDPATTLWTMLANPLHKHDYGGSDEKEESRHAAYKRYWIELCKTLLQARRDYDHLDPHTLAERGVVEDGVIRVGDAAYELVLLPPLTNLESRAWDKLKRFIDAGGQVIAMGMLPHESIEGDDRVAREMRAAFGLSADAAGAADFWGERGSAATEGGGENELPVVRSAEGQRQEAATCGANDEVAASAAQERLSFVDGGSQFSEEVRGAMLDLLDQKLPEQVRLESEARSLLVHQRDVAAGVRAVFATHQEDGEVTAELIIDGRVLEQAAAGSNPGNLETDQLSAWSYDLETGQVTALALRQADGNEASYQVTLRFAPYQSHVVLISSGEATAACTGSVSAKPSELKLSVAGPWRMAPLRDNAIRFDAFDMSVRRPDESAAPLGGTFRADAKTFIDQLGEAVAAGITLPLAFEQPFGTPVRTAIAYPLQASYEAVFEVDVLPERCQLLMDRSAIGGTWRLMVNGHALTEADFDDVRFYDNSNVSCEVAPLLTTGENRLTVEVEIGSDWHGVTDAIYLVGAFGVSFAAPNHPRMTKLPTQAELKAAPYPGLPYYAGDLVFSRTFELGAEELPGGERFRLVFADFDSAFHDCAAVSVNGHALGLRPWTPYSWVGDTAILKPGPNRVEVTVTSTLIGLLEGRYFDKASHTLPSVQEHPLFRAAK